MRGMQNECTLFFPVNPFLFMMPKDYYPSYIDFLFPACHYKKISGSIRECILSIILQATVPVMFYFRYNQKREEGVRPFGRFRLYPMLKAAGGLKAIRSDVHKCVVL